MFFHQVHYFEQCVTTFNPQAFICKYSLIEAIIKIDFHAGQYEKITYKMSFILRKIVFTQGLSQVTSMYFLLRYQLDDSLK